MSGYKWDPVFRVVPRNGGETIYWLTDRLTDVGTHTKITLRYVESMNIREDINRSLRPVVYGLRPEVEIECLITTMDDQTFLKEIEDALLLPNHYNVFLSLDGGCVEREVVLASVSNAEPIRGKTVIGATFKLAVRCVDLIPRKPAMMTDPLVGREMLQDGSIEMWTAGNPDNWTRTSASLTVVQETVFVRVGGSSARVLRMNSGFIEFRPLGLGIQNSSGPNANRSCWYRYGGSVLGVGITNYGYRLQIFNATRNTAQALISDGLIPNGTCADYEAYFRLPRDLDPNDSVYPRLCGYFGEVGYICYDDISIYGPVLRPGIATW